MQSKSVYIVRVEPIRGSGWHPLSSLARRKPISCSHLIKVMVLFGTFRNLVDLANGQKRFNISFSSCRRWRPVSQHDLELSQGHSSQPCFLLAQLFKYVDFPFAVVEPLIVFVVKNHNATSPLYIKMYLLSFRFGSGRVFSGIKATL